MWCQVCWRCFPPFCMLANLQKGCMALHVVPDLLETLPSFLHAGQSSERLHGSVCGAMSVGDASLLSACWPIFRKAAWLCMWCQVCWRRFPPFCMLANLQKGCMALHVVPGLLETLPSFLHAGLSFTVLSNFSSPVLRLLWWPSGKAFIRLVSSRPGFETLLSHGTFFRLSCCWLVTCLLNVPATCECISRTDLLRQFYVLPH